MTENTQHENVFSFLKAVWRRGQKHHLAAGALACFRWAVPLFLVGMAIDWLTRMPAPGRVVIFGLLLTVSLYKAWHHGWRHLRAFSAAHTALRVEEHHGGLESLVVSAVQFRESTAHEQTSRAMRDLTMSKAEEAVAPLPPGEVVSHKGLRLPLVVVLILTLVIGLFAVMNGPFLAAGISRIFPPWKAVEYPTRTQLEVASGDMVVKEGAPALIQARVSGVLPGEAEVALRTGSGEPRVHELEIADGVCEYPIDSAFRTFEYRFMAGDARSRWHSVEVIASPRIDRARVSLEFPAYTERSNEVVEALTVTVPEETQIKWELTLDRPVSEAVYTPGGGDPRPLEISPDGLTVTMSEVATESRAYSFSWVEKEHGFSFAGANHYLQVAPDQPPRVEITSPRSSLYATLGRAIDLAYRARDDHGIGESMVAYRVNKIEEVKVPFTASKLGEGDEQPIEWDYRTALTNLAVGDAVSFVVEVADRYPGTEGPHRARSQARRVTFLSVEDYLAQIAKQRLRLLSQLRNIYREERAVHETIQNLARPGVASRSLARPGVASRSLAPADDVFVQTCQLEAVRQDMMRERLGALKARMDDLLADLGANNITNESETATLTRLSTELKTVAEEHVGRAASSLRELASASNSNKDAQAGALDSATAVHMVDRAARELALMVLQVGFNEATEVMARELHAIAETQARLRLETMVSSDDAKALSDTQDRLAQWITRLFGGTPQDKESTIDDALVAFNLSRLIKELRSAGVETKMAEAVTLIRDKKSGDAVGLQAEVIEALLAAEFRLRIGSEREALVKAGDLFQSQVNDLKNLRAEGASLTPEQFNQRKAEFTQGQTALQRKLHLLLMPAVPAPRPRLFDVDLPPAPPVDDLLGAAEGAMENTLVHIRAGDWDKAATQQQQAESSFDALTQIVNNRIDVLTERNRVNSRVAACGKQITEIGQFIERQLVLLEMTEDAEDDNTELARISLLEQKLANEVEKFRAGIVEVDQAQATAGEALLPLLTRLEKAVLAMTSAVPSFKDNQVDDAIAHQETALETLESAGVLLEKQAEGLTSLASTLRAEWLALMPAPYVADIQAEQRDLVEAVPKAKKEELPRLAIVQKNLVHAVNAVLASLDPLAHQIESGTVFLFAKDDMDAAAIALEANDLAEAEDAGSFVAETLQDLLVKLEKVTPQYTYVLEVTEFFHEIVSEGMILRAAQSQLREKAQASADAAAGRGLVEEQRALETRAIEYGSLLEKAMGQERYHETARAMSIAVSKLAAGDLDAAVEQMEVAEETLDDDIDALVELVAHFAVLLDPPMVQPDPQVLFTLEVLALASQQKVLYRKTQIATAEQAAGMASKQREFAKTGEAFVPRAESHPKLVAASRSMQEAASSLESSSPDRAISSQQEAGGVLRHFVIEYVQKYVIPPGPPPPSDPAVTDPTESLGDDFTLFMPGAVSGGKPKGGRQEWEVLGRRDRAALNENFARELPLEYRAILKDYYERLAK